jgi:hypothetical protein
MLRTGWRWQQYLGQEEEEGEGEGEGVPESSNFRLLLEMSDSRKISVTSHRYDSFDVA